MRHLQPLSNQTGDTWKRRVWTDVQAEDELLGDAQQAGPDGHDQQTQSAEHMDGEIGGT